MTTPDLAHRFAYHPPRNDSTRHAHQEVRSCVGVIAEELDRILPDGREKALTLTKLEEAMMWANASVARNGGPADEQDSPPDLTGHAEPNRGVLAMSEPFMDWLAGEPARNYLTRADERVNGLALGDRVRVLDSSGFRRGAEGVVKHMMASRTFRSVLVDLGDGEFYFSPAELEATAARAADGEWAVVPV